MSRGLLILLLGLGAGFGAYSAYYHLHEANADSLDGELGWMKTELGLSDAQFARIHELHEASGPRLQALSTEVAQMQQEFAAFEHTRQTSDRVDFIEFAQFVQARRAVNEACLESTRQLVRASALEMNPGQRERYFGIVAAATPPASLPAN